MAFRCISSIQNRYILAQLHYRRLLSFSTSTPISQSNSDVPSPPRKPVDELFLSPVERLGGVFLQKLVGKAATEKALSSVGVELNVRLIAGVLSLGNLNADKMVTFFNWALKTHPQIPKNVDTYHVILEALGKKGFFDHMMGIVRDMRGENVNPDLKTLSIAVDSLLEAKMVDKALDLYRNDLEAEFGLEMNTESLNVVLDCLRRRSEPRAAKKLMRSMKEKVWFDAESYNALIAGYSSKGNVRKMERSLEAMVDEGIEPDPSTVARLIEGFGEARRVDESLRLFEGMFVKNGSDSGLVPGVESYNAVIKNLILVENYDEAMRFYSDMINGSGFGAGCEPNEVTFATLIHGLLGEKVRRVADALEVFDDMLKRGLVPRDEDLTLFIKGLCRYGPSKGAMIVYERARKAGFTISDTGYKLLIERLGQLGECGVLMRVWEEMKECGYPSDLIVYESLVECFCNVGDFDNAVFFMEECFGNGFCPGNWIWSKLRNKLLEADKVQLAYRLECSIKIARLENNERERMFSKRKKSKKRR